MSEQITLTLPSVSTLGSFLTMALRFDIRNTPRASVTVTTMGRPSGMAATASETVRRHRVSAKDEVMEPARMPSSHRRLDSPPMVNISSQLRFCHTPIKQMMPITPNEMAERRLASSSIAT